MKVSERIKEIRDELNYVGVIRTTATMGIIINAGLIQLEADIIEALQIAWREGYQAGLDWMLNEGGKDYDE